MATRLDQKSDVISYWLHLGQEFNLSAERLKEIEYASQFTQVLMDYLYTKKPNLTVGTFYQVVQNLEREDVLEKLNGFIVGEFEGNRHFLADNALKRIAL